MSVPALHNLHKDGVTNARDGKHVLFYSGYYHEKQGIQSSEPANAVVVKSSTNI